MVLAIENTCDFDETEHIAKFTQSISTEGNVFLPFVLEAQFVAVFRVGANVAVDEKEIYIGSLFPQAVFPYLRGHVYDMTIRGGFAPMILPLSMHPAKKEAPITPN